MKNIDDINNINSTTIEINDIVNLNTSKYNVFLLIKTFENLPFKIQKHDDLYISINPQYKDRNYIIAYKYDDYEVLLTFVNRNVFLKVEIKNLNNPDNVIRKDFTIANQKIHIEEVKSKPNILDMPSDVGEPDIFDTVDNTDTHTKADDTKIETAKDIVPKPKPAPTPSKRAYSSNPNYNIAEIKDKIKDILFTEYQGYFESTDEIKSLCPFHKENNPSFNYNIKKNVYQCFSCSVTGNTYELAKHFNIKLPNKQNQIDFSELLNNAINIAKNNKFPKYNYIPKTLKDLMIGLDRNNNIHYSYYDYKGKSVGFKVVSVNDKKRQFWLPKGLKNPIYLVDRLKEYNKEKTLYICEGEPDTAMMYQEGYQAIGVSGKNGISNPEVLNSYIKEFKSIVLCFDYDVKIAQVDIIARVIGLSQVKAINWESLKMSLKKTHDLRDIIEENKNLLKLLLEDNLIEFDINESASEKIRYIRFIRLSKEQKDLEKKDIVANFVFKELSKMGSWYFNLNENVYYFFNNEDKTLYNIRTTKFDHLLYVHFYLIKADTEYYKFTCDVLWNECIAHGKEVIINKMCWYNKKKNILYIHNNKNHIYKVTKNKIELKDNGTDGVIFLENDYEEIVADTKIDDDNNKIDLVLKSPNFLTSNDKNEKELSSLELHLLYTIWFYSLFFYEILPTRPIMCITGEKGSAKSSSFELIKLLFSGNIDKCKIVNVYEDKKEANNFIINNFFWFFDNHDSKNTGKLSYFEDWFAGLSTGVEIDNRILYTTNENVKHTPRGFAGITSRTPYFRRDDIADRLLIIPVERIEPDKVIAQSDLYDNILENRNEIWNSLLNRLRFVLEAIEKPHKGSIGFRLADFGKFLLTIMNKKVSINIGKELLVKLTREQSSFTLENNPISDALSVWIEQTSTSGLEVMENNGRNISSRDLYSELLKIDEKIAKSYTSFIHIFLAIINNLRTEYHILKEKSKNRKEGYIFNIKTRD